MCLNLYFRKWLKPTLRRVSKIRPKTLPSLHVEFAFGLKKAGIADLRLDIEGGYSIRLSKELHRIRGKKYLDNAQRGPSQYKLRAFYIT